MAKRLLETGLRLHKLLWLAAAGFALCAALPALSQDGLINAPEPRHEPRLRMLPDRLPDKPSQPPAFAFPVGPLGFSAPGSFYLGQRNSLVSLDFLDEDRLLFTFRVPGLIRREAVNDEQRQIRAIILKLPAGAVEAESVWTLHDHSRYLWMLKNGHFLLRDRNNLELGDASLELKPYLRFPGPMLWLEMDPTQQFMVTDSREPRAAKKSSDAQSGSERPSAPTLPLQPTEQKSPGGQSTGLEARETADATDEQPPASGSDLAVRVLRQDSGQVILVSRTRTAVHLPINSDGYLEALRSRGNGWLLNLNYFSGGSTILGQIESACSPLFDFLSHQELLITACTSSGEGKLEALETDGRRLWELGTSEMAVWPVLVKAPDGSRLARETLVFPYPVSARAPLDPGEIKGQLVEVLDAANGNIALEATAAPPLDMGGNVAISPSGRRVAILNGSKIEVYELPPAPPLAKSGAHQAAR